MSLYCARRREEENATSTYSLRCLFTGQEVKERKLHPPPYKLSCSSTRQEEVRKNEPAAYSPRYPFTRQDIEGWKMQSPFIVQDVFPLGKK
ncbi:hypothetical protein CDAR_491451 [Caerostris darwini]|uniref:Uncharacterized protein n=1 Tax=Caerostris darwini TaxID=1538125 RepID=A0AAV4XAJ0_9ARAC|nr:hypothetical protein CDAR_491451 [Caerostris darwini]